MSFHVPEKFRITSGPMASWTAYGNNGAFKVRIDQGPIVLFVYVIASDQMGWEHVSVSLPNRCPTWDEMCHIKALFWDAEDCVIQYHPPASQYVNRHPYCIHLWLPIGVCLPMSPSLMVG